MSHQSWVSLRILRNCVNPVPWASFKFVQHCPFWHTCRIYPHALYNSLLPTTSDDAPGQEVDKIAPTFVVEVSWGVYIHYFLVPKDTPSMTCHLSHVQDNPQVCWQLLADMSLLAIGESENPPKYHSAIHRTIIKICWCTHPYLPALMNNMLAASYELSMLPKRPGKCVSSPQSPVLLTGQYLIHLPPSLLAYLNP